MISAIDLLKEWRNCCQNAEYCNDCEMLLLCSREKLLWTDEKIVQSVKLLRERKEERERLDGKL